MVECQLPKLDVVGSSPISRSKKFKHLAPPLPTCTPLYSVYITRERSNWSTTTFLRSTGDLV